MPGQSACIVLAAFAVSGCLFGPTKEDEFGVLGDFTGTPTEEELAEFRSVVDRHTDREAAVGNGTFSIGPVPYRACDDLSNDLNRLPFVGLADCLLTKSEADEN